MVPAGLIKTGKRPASNLLPMPEAKQDPVSITGSLYLIFNGDGSISKTVLNSIDLMQGKSFYTGKNPVDDIFQDIFAERFIMKLMISTLPYHEFSHFRS